MTKLPARGRKTPEVFCRHQFTFKLIKTIYINAICSVVKSGYDFFDLSAVTIELEDKPNAVRKKVIKSVQGGVSR